MGSGVISDAGKIDQLVFSSYLVCLCEVLAYS